eukprot:UN00173
MAKIEENCTNLLKRKFAEEQKSLLAFLEFVKDTKMNSLWKIILQITFSISRVLDKIPRGYRRFLMIYH